MRTTPSRVTSPLILDAPITRNQLDTSGFVPLVGTTPTVTNLEFFLSHSSNTTVTKFLHGKDCQSLYILGNGHTTIANNANIKTSTGANKLLASNKMYHFKHYNGVFYEVTT